MNITTTLTSTTRVALGATFAALCLGAAACGSETTADPAGSIKQSSQQQHHGSPRAAELEGELEARTQRERAERADAKRWARGHESSAPSSGSQKFPDLLP